MEPSINYLIHELFEQRVKKSANKIALICDNNEMTYNELNRRANYLARKLQQEGIRSGMFVGIFMEKSFDMVISLMAILKVGAAYVPLDPEYPEKRIEYIIEDCRLKFIISNFEPSNGLKVKWITTDISSNGDSNDKDFSSNLPKNITPNCLAYIIYTSGTTGDPKGVMVEHKSVINLLHGISDVINFSSTKTIIALTTLSFDISIVEILLPLMIGMKVVIAKENQQNPRTISKLIRNHNINIMQTTPSRLRIILDDKKSKTSLSNLSEILIGGDKVSTPLITDVMTVTNANLYNMYGPTETTVWSTIKKITDPENINIGKPIHNTSVYITSHNQVPLLHGELGELCISGEGLARGYIEKNLLTSKKFIWLTDEKTRIKLYRTGDLARFLPNGDIQIYGRIDHQVKIRGYRIDPLEIERFLEQHPDIINAIVIAKEYTDGHKRLLAFYCSKENIDIRDLNMVLKDVLPEYMHPSKYIKLESFPLTSNGKIDRKKLQENINIPNIT